MELSAVLFDRDGTVIVDRHYLGSAEGVELIPGAGQALALLREKGLSCFLVSNQSGIGRGYFPESGWHECHARLQQLLAAFGAGFDDARFCPHAPEEACRCRKPAPGMLLRAADDWFIDLERSWMIGDKMSDIIAGRAAGCTPILLTTDIALPDEEPALLRAASLGEAADLILSNRASGQMKS